ncbi:MAG: transglutaminase-like domain-containing protein [Deltaproteobacteria bacterium]|nr:transglutaminase-like domain-containing protein [Deltaproteobacteria bacterium]
MTEELREFLEPAPGIESRHPAVMDLAARVTRGATDPWERAGALFEYTRDTVRYNLYQPFWRLEDYLATTVLERGKGYCAHKSCLLTALARAAGIPARLGFADLVNHLLPPAVQQFCYDGLIYRHCFVEWRLDGRWWKATPSFDARLTAEQGWRLVEFRPQWDLLLPATDQAGRPHIEYVRQHGWRTGFPLKEVLAAWDRDYGSGWALQYRSQVRGQATRDWS